jgi:large subunit ribosomal protein L9
MTKIVLKKDVTTLGKAGTLVEVAPGYARNFLIPQGLAVKATAGIIKEAEQRLAKQREIAAKLRAEALETKKTLEAHSFFEISAPVGEDGNQLFGTVTAQDIADVVAKKTGIALDRREITIEEPIKTTGVYAIKARVYADVFATVRIQVNPQ